MPELNSQNYVSGSDYFIFLLAVLVRWCVSLHSYSGEKTPPMFGDYEAQRHWMEITYNIPVQDWYKNTRDNNLTYWGLDYPPLTAYHSYLCGFFGSIIVPESIELHSSKGYESYYHKLFMRCSVLIVDLLIYVPAVYLYFKFHCRNKEQFSSSIGIFLTLLYPGLILIDYGHFQFNCVSLGFFVASVAFISSQNFYIATVLFCLAVNYKQMEFYHSLPFFFFFLGKFFLFIRNRMFVSGFKFIIPIAVIVLLTFFAVWYPFLMSSNAQQVLHRIFPVSRGLYEDKVATFWCVFNVIYKVHGHVENDIMLQVCLLVTLVSTLPSIINLTVNPILEKFKLSLIVCSFCFFLFSYHVHEKSILLVAIPVALDFPRHPVASAWFLLISTFSMVPLIIKDGLFLPYLSLFVFYYLCCVFCAQNLNTRCSSLFTDFKNIGNIVINLSLVGCLVLSFVSRFCPPPGRFPFLWPLLVSCYSFVHFFGFLVYYYYVQCGFGSVKRKGD